MDNVGIDGLICIRESNLISGLPIWSYFIRKAVSANFNVNIILFVHVKEDLPFDILADSRINIVELFELDNNINKLKEILTNDNIKSVIFMDSVELMIKNFSFIKCISFISQLTSKKCSVILLTNQRDLYWKKIQHLSNTTISLDIFETNFVSTTRTIKKDRGYSEKKENYGFKNGQLSTWAYVPKLLDINSEVSNDDSLLKDLTFDVGLKLSETERLAKKQVQLPYIKAQNETGKYKMKYFNVVKGLVGLNINSGKKIRAGGQILYTPDKEDDFDDSDPDEDLMI